MSAIQLTLEEDPNIRLSESQLEASRGAALASSGRFDTLLEADALGIDSRTPESETESVTVEAASQSATVSRLLRSGQFVSSSVELEQSLGASSVSTGTVSFAVRQPLLRGRRREAVTAEEKAALVEIEASRLDLLHRVAERLLAATNQYWEVRAACFDVEVLIEAELRSGQLLETTERLVAADLRPAADLIQLEADLASRRANRIAGGRGLFRSFQTLAATLGLEASGSADLVFPSGLGLPSDEFPAVDLQSLPESPAEYLAEAMASRADLGAARARREASVLRLVGARDALRPRLDLVLSPSVTGLVEDDGFGDSLLALGQNVPGVSADLALSFSLPIPNRVAEGNLILFTEASRQQELLIEARRIEIAADVQSAHDAVRSNAERVEVLERSVELFRQALENEEKKLRVGNATLIDVIDQTDRLTSAQQRLVAAKLSLAQALATLRFVTGTLVRPDGVGADTVDADDLTTLPLGGT